MKSFARLCGAAAAALALAVLTSPARQTFAQTVQAGDVIISEFRFRGPAGTRDEFVELYNNTDQAITVQSTDGSGGWLVGQLEEGGQVVNDVIYIPNGAVIPARGHYLAACTYQFPQGGTYSLGAYAAPDLEYGALVSEHLEGVVYPMEFGDEAGIALFSTTNPNNLSAATRLDAVGFTTADALYREGAGLAPAAGITASAEFSFVRHLSGGVPQDTGDNAADFVLVATDPQAVTSAVAVLGAPGPESSASPVRRDSGVSVGLLNPNAPATSSPNRVRNTTPVTNGQQGTLSLQRTVTNNTGAAVTRLRFRVRDITTRNSPVVYAQQADMRVLGSSGVVTRTDGSVVVVVSGLTLEQPPNQPKGGGLNSSLSVALPGGGLAPGQSINVQFLLGVQQGGSFNFVVGVEALP